MYIWMYFSYRSNALYIFPHFLFIDTRNRKFKCDNKRKTRVLNLHKIIFLIIISTITRQGNKKTLYLAQNEFKFLVFEFKWKVLFCFVVKKKVETRNCYFNWICYITLLWKAMFRMLVPRYAVFYVFTIFLKRFYSFF